jgi:CO dehydrogenase/acetyl-CoA synthase beta subunit
MGDTSMSNPSAQPANLAYSGLSPHLKEKIESHIFSDVSQVLQRTLDCKSRAKESRSFLRTKDKPRNERHVNTVEYSSESSDDEEADMCVAEWSWGSKSKPFVCSSLKSAFKSRQDEIRYTFDVAKCGRIFDYLLQEK